MRTWAKLKAPLVDIDTEHETFCDYWRAHGKAMADWNACWRNWMRRAPQMGGAMKSPGQLRAEQSVEKFAALAARVTAIQFRAPYPHEPYDTYESALRYAEDDAKPRRVVDIHSLVRKLKVS
jgi:hypothetical protein